VTGYDIIFFWVARMIFSGIENTGDIPFDTVFIHGLVRDALGRKMSKSLGNGIDPLEEIEKYGADALRFTLAVGVSPGNDLRYSEEKVTSCRNFANKMWNAARFLLMNGAEEALPDLLPDTLALEDRWILSRFNDVVGEVTDNMDRYEIGVAIGKIYDFAWDVFCDWYIEIVKTRLSGGSDREKADCRQVLVYVFTGILKLLHPFMPFLTEELYQNLPHSAESIMVAPWPKKLPEMSFPKEEADFTRIMDIIRAVRAMRAEKNVPYSRRTSIAIESEFDEVFRSGEEYKKRLAYASDVITGKSTDSAGSVSLATDSARILIPLAELIDKQAEAARLGREKEAVNKEISAVSSRLSNGNFTSKAPANVVELERQKLKKAQERLLNIERSIASLDAI